MRGPLIVKKIVLMVFQKIVWVKDRFRKIVDPLFRIIKRVKRGLTILKRVGRSQKRVDDLEDRCLNFMKSCMYEFDLRTICSLKLPLGYCQVG